MTFIAYLSKRNVNYIVDADIKGFFDNVTHEWIMKFLEHRIADNYSYLKKYLYTVRRCLFKVLNRLSQRRRYNWLQFNKVEKVYKLAKPKIYVNIFELRLDIKYIL